MLSNLKSRGGALFNRSIKETFVCFWDRRRAYVLPLPPNFYDSILWEVEMTPEDPVPVGLSAYGCIITIMTTGRLV